MALSSFEYRTLNSEAQEIRILQLQPAHSTSVPISCELIYTNLSNPLNYDALSYTWGDPVSTLRIVLNGQDFWVTKNLEVALKSLRLLDEPRHLWVDAICINQMDIPERNSQVPMMQRIYSSAKRVVVWLGPHLDGSETAMDFLNELSTEDPTRDLTTDEDAIANSLAQETKASIWKAVAKLCQRNYWGRVWIWQELICGKETILMCGNNSVRWHALGNLASTIQSLKSSSASNTRTCQKLGIVNQFQIIAMLRLIADRWLLKKPFYLWGYLVTNHLRQCSDQKDRIYAFIALATDCQNGTFAVDYKRSVGQVYIDASIHCIVNTHKSLTVLYNAAGQNPRHNLPSWVADWSCTTHDSPFVTTRTGWNACGTPGANFTEEIHFSKNFRILTVSGVIIGTLTEVVDRGYSIEMSVGGSVLTHLCRILKLWTQLVLEKTSSSKLVDYGDDQEAGLIEAVWHCVILGEAKSRGREDETRAMFDVLRGATTLPNGYKYDSEMSYAYNIGVYALFLTDICKITLENRTLFLSGQSLIGLCREEGKQGDLICILDGGKIPVILRKQDEYYAYKGPAYVHGFMRGEVIQPLQDKIFTKQQFSLC